MGLQELTSITKIDSQGGQLQKEIDHAINSKLDDAKFLSDILKELTRARTKFPDSAKSLAALTEEVGELAQAILQGKSDAEIWGEAVQVAVMALRVAVEGDATLK